MRMTLSTSPRRSGLALLPRGKLFTSLQPHHWRDHRHCWRVDGVSDRPDVSKPAPMVMMQPKRLNQMKETTGAGFTAVIKPF
jgi:hypothetical protein